MFSGKIIFNRAMPERLRTLRHCIFTGGVVEENGSCRAAFCESAARRGIKLPQSPTATAPSEMGPLAKPETFPPCQRLPPRGSWQNRQVLTEGVSLPSYAAALVLMRCGQRRFIGVGCGKGFQRQPEILLLLAVFFLGFIHTASLPFCIKGRPPGHALCTKRRKEP